MNDALNPALPAVPALPALPALRVLIIDDDMVDRLAIRRTILKFRPDAVVEEAGDGEEGLEHLRRNAYDCVLLDYRLPRRDGLTVLREIRAGGFQAPVIVLTGQGDEQLAVEIMKAGASDYLPKGALSPQTLAKSFEYAIRTRKAEDTLAWMATFPELSPHPIIELDFDGGITYVNPAAHRRFPDLMHVKAAHPMLQDLAAVTGRLPSGESPTVMREVQCGAAWFHQTLSLFPDRQVLRIYAIDITERKAAEQQLLHDAFHDGLTGLFNRSLFINRLSHSLEIHRRRDTYAFAVLFLDMDRFKIVNDSLGHLLGDQLLIAVARRLEECLRPGDTVARLGGDEFSMLLDDITGLADATRVAQRIMETMSEPFALEGHEVYATTSIGIACSTTGYTRPQDMLRDADTAMYRAKALGRARCEVFGQEMHAHALNLLQLEMDLRRAIERDEFEVYYQPIIALGDRRIAGFEALARWRHPDRGLILPEEFIPLAEETGLIIAIDRRIMRQACLQVAEWHRRHPRHRGLSLSANVSSRQFLQPELIDFIQQTLEETGLEAGDLKLEITESVVMSNPENTVSMLLKLKALDVRLQIDDFGTGYSSLSYLQRFHIDSLKIDRSFIHHLGNDEESLEIVRTIVSLAHNLHMEVLAEGVETEEQLDLLRDLKCEYAQGFYFSHPVPAEQIDAMLEKG